MRKNKLLQVLLLPAFAVVLASCDSDIVNYPSNASSKIVDVTFTGEGQSKVGEITDNEYSDVYKKYSNVPSNTLDTFLYNKAKEVVPAAFGFANDTEFFASKYCVDKYKKEMMKSARSGTYSTDNVFDEYRFASTLIGQMYQIKTSEGKTDYASLKSASFKGIVTPDMNFNDVFKLDYSDYINRYFKPTYFRQYLVANYIYEHSYQSIGNTLARGTSIITLEDPTDYPGLALDYINVFFDKYIANASSDATVSSASLRKLERLWKGLKEDGTPITSSDSEYSFYTSELTFKLNGQEVPNTAYNRIQLNASKVTPGNEYKTDSTLETSFSSTNTYTVEKGINLAISSLQISDLVTEDIYMKSSGITDMPSSLTDRIFSTNYVTNVDNVASGASSDNSYVKFFSDNYIRFVTPAKREASDAITGQDLSFNNSGKYYLATINNALTTKLTVNNATYDTSEIVSTSRISKNSSDSQEVANFKRDLAYEVAFNMATTDTYKKASIVYLFTHNHISYSDPDFYDYMKTNYSDCFNSDGMPIYKAE